MSEIRKLTLGSRVIGVEFERKRIRNINVRVRRDGTLYCSIPYGVDINEAMRFIISKQDYLLKAIDDTVHEDRTRVRARQFVDGEIFDVFGKPFILKVESGAKNTCGAENGIITLTVKDVSDYRSKYMTFEKWRRNCIRSVIVDLCGEVYPLFAQKGVAPPKKITLGEYKSFWGECFSKRGELKFSYRLFEKDREIIRYVVIHEFAHFIEPNHSSRFWAIVGEYVPDYKALRKKLNNK
ncbi:M48 family metallopeptidase [Butyrivibrio sp. AE2032]|uniref:M48 family metallopeptidase n=1 Tax=Butyrivibrio sp. AE2032 TaxID=1458463 RepID=UPI0006921606|nr:SprT family zinc-dependent metalloprotease [Butyrivibrio sp. AE2032]